MGAAVKQFRVTAPCVVHIPVASAAGTALGTFYRDAVLPSDVPAERIKQLLDSGLIEQVGAEPAPASETPKEPKEPVSDPPSVNSRSSKAELVDYGVSRGDDRAALEEMTRDQLLGRYVRNP